MISVLGATILTGHIWNGKIKGTGRRRAQMEVAIKPY